MGYITENQCNVYTNVVEATKQVVGGVTLITTLY